jgi:hypothetical protein
LLLFPSSRHDFDEGCPLEGATLLCAHWFADDGTSLRVGQEEEN